MALRCGIVGLPNLGKSSIFNALTASKVAAENYSSCTIESNTGVVPVGGASRGEGLCNPFLAHIRAGI